MPKALETFAESSSYIPSITTKGQPTVQVDSICLYFLLKSIELFGFFSLTLASIYEGMSP
jgi:hypothetical protein